MEIQVQRRLSPSSVTSGRVYDLLIALLLTLCLHGAVILIAAVPQHNYFFPFLQPGEANIAGSEDAVNGADPDADEAGDLSGFAGAGSLPDGKGGDVSVADGRSPGEETQKGRMQESRKRSPGTALSTATSNDEGRATDLVALRLTSGITPARSAAQAATDGTAPTAVISASAVLPPLLRPESTRHYRSLFDIEQLPTLQAPGFSGSTIPPPPPRLLVDEVSSAAESYLASDVMNSAVPVDDPAASAQELAVKEAVFRKRLAEDIQDGRLDMHFSTFMLGAEYFQLRRILLARGMQPAFSLEDATALFARRAEQVGRGLPEQPDAYALMLLLQRYGDNKYYPANGTGMLLDGLFHHQNDCEGGTKEVLAYLDQLYPQLQLGTSRGLIPTTSGQLIGHMQVYIGPDTHTAAIVPGSTGLAVETTRVGLNSVMGYSEGEIFPLEDFVYRYYPDLVPGTPLAARYVGEKLDGRSRKTPGELTDEWQNGERIVGSSNSPLKIDYGVPRQVLSSQRFDLANIRRQRIANELRRSDIPGCDPRIDPAAVDRTNLFSNFVAIDPQLRKSLLEHYLASMEYRDNLLTPQWQREEWTGYGDLLATLAKSRQQGLSPESPVPVDRTTRLPLSAFAGHQRFLDVIRQSGQPPFADWISQGAVQCENSALLSSDMAAFLFTGTTQPGTFLLHSALTAQQWNSFQTALLNDCLVAAPGEQGIESLREEARAEDLSLRRELYRQAAQRGLGEVVDFEAMSRGRVAQQSAEAGRFVDTVGQAEESGAADLSAANILKERLALLYGLFTGRVQGGEAEESEESVESVESAGHEGNTKSEKQLVHDAQGRLDGRYGLDRAVYKGRYSEPSSTSEPSVAESFAFAGRTGLNSGLLWDGADFFPPETYRSLLLSYVGRVATELDMHRAMGLAENLVHINLVHINKADLETGDAEPENGGPDSFVDTLQASSVDSQLRLALTIVRARLRGESGPALSARIAGELSERVRFEAGEFEALLSYGLNRADGRELVRTRLSNALRRLGSQIEPGGAIFDRNPSDPPDFQEEAQLESLHEQLYELQKAAVLLQDRQPLVAMMNELLSHLTGFFEAAGDRKRMTISGGGAEAEFNNYSALLNEFCLLMLLREQHSDVGVQGSTVSTGSLYSLDSIQPVVDRFLAALIGYAAVNPVGGLLLTTVPLLFPEPVLEQGLARIIVDHLALQPVSLKKTVQSRVSSDTGPEIWAQGGAQLLGETNAVCAILRQMGEESRSKLKNKLNAALKTDSTKSADLLKASLAGPESRSYGWYLLTVHRLLAERLVPAWQRAGTVTKAEENGNAFNAKSASNASNAWAGPKPVGADPVWLPEFYQDPRVARSFSLLAELAPERVKVPFRKMRDLRDIKDPSKIKVVVAERRISRQDMALLTLALNPDNSPELIARSWQRSLEVIGGHLGLQTRTEEKGVQSNSSLRTGLPQNFYHYLYAPNAPYLFSDSHGFFYGPEDIADLHNAARWAGRMDLLLSSYLHFRNLPRKLPDWLLRAALHRYQQEREVLARVERQTFLPMILECDSDWEELPKPLFQAKWQVRKPYGEDIFPATLLLLRLGYLEITEDGQFKETAGLSGGADSG